MTRQGEAGGLKLSPPIAPDLASAQELIEQVLQSALKKGVLDEASASHFSAEQMPDGVLGMLSTSPYLKGLALRRPELLFDVLSNDPHSVLEKARETLQQAALDTNIEADVMTALRCFKDRLAFSIAYADLLGLWDVMTVTRALTAGADHAVSTALNWIWRTYSAKGDFETDEVKGIVILAMGKHGGHELNYSSDIDLIVLFDPDRINYQGKRSLPEALVRITKDLVKLLQTRTSDGYVFRVDLRLRPDPGSTQVAIDMDSALQYYEVFGQNWERAAMIKARPIAGDLEAGWDFLMQIRPFIWRRHLDYAAIADVHAMKRQIHAVKGHAQVCVEGHDLKLGRGGIREIEFFVQTQQLIGGGKNPLLRSPRTLDGLDALALAGWIEEPVRDELRAVYLVHRALEHRVQMINDEQTHRLPEQSEKLTSFAAFCGFPDPDVFRTGVLEALRTVEKHYAALFEMEPSLAFDNGDLNFTGVEAEQTTLNTLSNFGFEDPNGVFKTIQRWHSGKMKISRSTRARELLTDIVPDILSALSRAKHPDRALAAFDGFLANLPSGIQFFSLLKQNPRLFSLISTIASDAPRLSQTLQRQPQLIESVVDPRFYEDRFTMDGLEEALERSIDDSASYEEILDVARMVGQEQEFRIGVRLLSGTLTPKEAAQAFSDLADVMVRRMFEAAWHEFIQVHGSIEGAQAAIVAMGRLGGQDMTASSDVDLILIYDHDPDAKESNGGKPLAPSHYFTRLTQRMVAALSAQTARGRLYEVDLRLRPSGRSGPLATHIDGFSRYQHEQAWTWEHMALTRARIICSAPPLREKINQTITDVLEKPRDRETLVSEIADMRGKIEAAHPAGSALDLKYVRGGLLDIEFLAQAHLLLAGDIGKEPTQNTINALTFLGEKGVMDQQAVSDLRMAASTYQSLIQFMRLSLNDTQKELNLTPTMAERVAEVTSTKDPESFHAEVVKLQELVTSYFTDFFGEVRADH